MVELFKRTNIDFLGKQKFFIGLSLVLTAIGLASWISKGSLKYGIDFTGGAQLTVHFAYRPPVEEIRKAVSARLPGELSVQEISGKDEVMIGTPLATATGGVKSDQEINQARTLMGEALTARFGESTGKLDFNNASVQVLVDKLRDPLQQASIPMSEQQLQDLARQVMEFKNTPPRSGLLRSFDELRGVAGVTPQIISVLKQQCYLPPFSFRGAEVVGPKIGAELRNKAVLATLYALGGMLVYIAFRFEWIYGLAAVIAVFHDVIITLGLFSVFNKEISLNVVAALLTLVGYSMNDTIVVFDRIRETLRLTRKDPFIKIVNDSINQTLSRTVLTSGLTFISAVSLLLFGGAVLNGFSFALVVGIIVGTYSSIFIASPILVFWQSFLDRRKRSAVAAGDGGRKR
jgi:preprotein translocase subunit SecF